MKILVLLLAVTQTLPVLSANAAISCTDKQKQTVCGAFYDSPPKCNLKKDHHCTCVNNGLGPELGAGTFCKTAGENYKYPNPTLNNNLNQ